MATKEDSTGSRRTKKPVPKKTGSKARIPKRPALPARRSTTGFPIVGMGASAGGLEAFEQFFANMTADSGMAFILVPHLDPTHISIMRDLLGKYTNMEVLQVTDGQKVQPNKVFIIPPNKNLALFGGTLQLLEMTKARGQRLPIDYFLRSLAQDQKERAVCIILSGTGTDGTLGLRAIKGALGMAMVQEPDCAKYDGMPRSAINTGLVDYISTPEQMPRQLIAYAKHAGQEVVPKIAPIEGKIPNEIQKILVLLRSHSGHDFASYKQNTICRRIERRMNVHQIESLSNYVRFLQQTPQEVDVLFKELLIGVTNFFRNPDAFESLKQEALYPLLHEKPEGESLRVWVPGCSSGEEAYSIAMILRECMDEIHRHFEIQIFGTDIDSDAIDMARAGIYPGSVSGDVDAVRLKRFFNKEDSVHRIKKDIREMLIFAPQSIIKDPPFTKLDLLCCRNLLIYLDSKLHKTLLPLFHYSLKPGGILFLGSSETTGEFVDLFSAVDRKWKIYKRKDTEASAQAMIEFPVGAARAESLKMKVLKSAGPSLSEMVEKILLDSFTPPCVLINEKGDIAYIHGRTGKFLEPAPGEAKLNISDMAREGLKLELSSAIRNAIAQNKEISIEGLRIKDNGSIRLVNFRVRPVTDPEPMQGLLMVLFEDMGNRSQPKPVKKRRDSGAMRNKRIAALERELMYTKEHLQTTIEELETSNEELQSTNEELQSTNEELQSTNEELETSKEELHSLNEELVTVNTELQGKIDELSWTNDDLRNLLESSEIATIFLNDDLLIKRFTPPANKVMNLIQSDVGRPIQHIVSNLKYTSLEEDARGVLKELDFKEREVQRQDGYWYKMRILPYRTVDNMNAGVVVTFVDIDAQKEAVEMAQTLNRELQHAHDYAESIVETIREPLLVLDENLRVVSANRSFYSRFLVDPKDTEGQFIYDLGNRQWDIPRLRQLLEVVLRENDSFESFEVDHSFPKIGRKKMLLNARKVVAGGGEKQLILLAFGDMTLEERGKQKSRMNECL